jgi:hypothetical protein
VPVAVLDEQPVVIGVNATHDRGALLSIHKATWQRNVSDSLLVQIELFGEIKALSSVAEKRGELLRRAEEGLRRSRDDYARLSNERTLLLQEAGKAKLDLARDDQRLAELKKGEGLLEKFVEEQQKIEDDEKDPEKQKFRQRVAEARLLEKDLEVERALEIYKQVLDGGYDDPALKKYYEDLLKRWQPANDEHRQAREFIYQTWPKLDTPRLKERMEEAHKGLAVCKKAGDAISIRKLLKGTEAHAIRLTKELGDLKGDLYIEDEKQEKVIKGISDALLKLADEIQRALPEKG